MIAFDIDGCINGIKDDIIRLGRNFFKDVPIEFCSSGYYLAQIYKGAPENIYDKFWETYGYEIYTNPPLAGVDKVIHFIKDHGSIGCYITARNKNKIFQNVAFEQITDQWLKKYGIELPVYYAADKAELAKKLGVALMIEDNPKNIIALQKVTDVLIYHHPYNENLKGTRVYDWNEIYQIVKERYGK